jgi:hypothetical protein
LSIAGCSASEPDSARFRRYFQLPETAPITTSTIQDAILRNIPIGSKPAEIEKYLELRGIGKDRLSSYSFDAETNRIVCKIEYNSKTLAAVKTSYSVFFVLTKAATLDHVTVKEWLTGL